MQVRVLGAHQGESRDMRFISMLIDDRLAIDAGGLTTSLSLEEQDAIEAVLLTHRHFDHIKDLPMFTYNVWDRKSVHVYCTAATRQALEDHIFNDKVWPDMSQNHPGIHPLVFHNVVPGEPFQLLGCEIYPVEMPHTVPTVGYGVRKDGRCFFYTADTRGTGEPPWASLRPDLLMIEATLVSADDEQAARFGHMTPVSVGQELRAFHDREGYFPRTVCVHLNARYDTAIREELATLSRDLGADVFAAREGMVIDV